MSASVNLLQERYRLNSMFLGREMEGVLSEGILALWEGDYRTKVMEQNYETRHLLLKKSLELYPDQGVRPVRNWPELDNIWHVSLIVEPVSPLQNSQKLWQINFVYRAQLAQPGLGRWSWQAVGGRVW